MTDLSLTVEQAKESIHARGRSRSEQLLVLLAIGGCQEKTTTQMRELAVKCGLRSAAKWKFADILRKSKCAIRTDAGWELTGTGRAKVAALAGVALAERGGDETSHARVRTTAPPVPSEGIETRSRNLMFMDVTGWSGLGPFDIHSYVTKAMPALAKEIKGAELVNTWGDAIVAVFDSAKSCAESALRIREFFRRSQRQEGIAEGLTCRIALHSGEVLACQNALVGKPDVFGHDVHLAARLEPVTTPGFIFCTDAFARNLGVLSGVAPKAWPLGNIRLPKGFGQVKVHVVSWGNESDPRPVDGFGKAAK